jgi:hypothetical protein
MGFGHEDITSTQQNPEKNSYLRKIERQEKKNNSKLPNVYVGSTGMN